ncbi:MAG TPA: hypothetical protein VMT23_03665 [Candidatus Binatia bacterium]|nr:hypothetical protein [Candidatus Binatia bacterium]
MSDLAKLLNEPDVVLAKHLDKLESLSGYNSEDVRLLADMQAATAKKIASLGLDPSDTTSEELHEALQAKLRQDIEHLAKAYNYKPTDSVDLATARLVELASHCGPVPTVVAIKDTVAKSLLRSNPPKKLMKQLNYRSLESMLKREDVKKLFAGAPAVESGRFINALEKSLQKLSAADFERRPLQYLALSSKRWAKVALPARPISYGPLIGAVLVWPVKEITSKQSLASVLQVLQAAEIIEVDSFYLSKHQFQSNFGKLAASLYGSDSHQSFLTEESLFDWHNVWGVFANQQTPLQRLARIHPALHWWKDAAHLMHLNSEPVSLNLADNLSSLQNGLAYQHASLTNAVSQLKTELLNRYAAHAGVKDYMAGQFNDKLALEVATDDSVAGDLSSELI